MTKVPGWVVVIACVLAITVGALIANMVLHSEESKARDWCIHQGC